MSWGFQVWISGVLLYIVSLAFLIAARVERKAAKHDRDVVDKALTLYVNGSTEEAANVLRGIVSLPPRDWSASRGTTAQEFIRQRRQSTIIPIDGQPVMRSPAVDDMIRRMRGI